MSDILCITDRTLCREDFLPRLEQIAAARPAGIVLREKDLSPVNYKALAAQVLSLCRRYDVPCILHTFVDIARELGAGAIHLPLPVLRELSPEDKAAFQTIGASCHSVEEALEAQALGATYLTAGHVFETTCKAGLPGRGLDFLCWVCAAVPLPVWAIGGIGPETLAPVLAAGARGGCVRSGLMTCPDPKSYLTQCEEARPMTFQREQLLLYAVTDRAWTGRQTLFEQVEDALKGGVTLVQLREKDLPQGEFLAEAKALRDLCHRYHVPLIINDNLEVALESGADGVHVGAEDQPVDQIRRRVGPGFIIGATAKTPAQAQAAQAAGADYLGVGAVFPSPTKEQAKRITREDLRTICASVSIPAVAIGGIALENVGQLRGGGMAGIAVVSALFGAEDVQSAARALKAAAREITQSDGKGGPR